ncbi:MAG: hypothetical protein MJ124_08610 [Lachnospiraceae bacterium]|nr:hypothetical protein [Lachnospiraceae bacterium]
MAFNLNLEINEAIQAGEVALRSLREADMYLRKAKNWGVMDILGGGLMTDLFKHSRVRRAQQCMSDAKCNLARFSRELDDIDEYIPDLNLGSFYTFADFFFDGLLADILMQSRIADARHQVSSAITQVERILDRLKKEVR